jgi:hypothetical protein
LDSNSEFFRLWRRVQGKDVEDQLPLCPVAAEFSRKIDELIFTPLGEHPTRAQILQAKLILQDEYHAWRKSLPHRHTGGPLARHRCIDEVYHAAYDGLHLRDLTLRPPVNLITEYDTLTKPADPPVPAPSPPAPRIAGLFIGEEE